MALCVMAVYYSAWSYKLLVEICSVWVARRPPGYAFVEFDDRRDALDAIQSLDGQYRASETFHHTLFLWSFNYHCYYYLKGFI